MNFVSKKVKVSLFATLVMLLFTSLLLSGCSENFAAVFGNTEKANTQEKTPEELEKEKEEQRKLEEEQKQRERELKEQALKEELGPFFVPLPPLEQEDNPPVKARGIYLTGNTVGLENKFSQLLDLVENTELNAMVIDVKNDHGLVTYPSQIEIVQQVKADKAPPIKDMKAVLAELKKRDIYPIARIVVFKDPHLPEQRPEWAIQKNSGGIWRDNKNVAWVNPYEKKVWDYNIAIAKEAALLGFREIQFDYVRFPENAKRVDREATYPGANGVPKDENIANFLAYAREQLKDYNVHLAADVFGVIATSWGDSDGIGQTWEKIAPEVEYNCPMIYPSHYGPGYFGFSVPDANPVGTIKMALTDAIERNAPLENPGIIRPWLQGFSAPWVKGHITYGAREIRQQIDTALELGIDEYLIWNASNRYIPEAFGTEEEYLQKIENFKKAREEKNHDVLGRTPDEALKEFLNAVAKKNWRQALVLHSTDFALDYVEYEKWVKSWTVKLFSYNIKENNQVEGKNTFKLDVTFKRDEGEEFSLNDQVFEVYKENNIWRVKPSAEFFESLTSLPEVDETETVETEENIH